MTRSVLTGCWTSHVCTLAVICSMMWSIYFVYGLPATLSISLQSHLSLSNSQYAYLVQALYTAFSAPNVVLPFCSGFLVRRYGERWVLLVCVTCIVGGQLMFAQAIMWRQIWAIIFGRALYGLGTEITGVLANSITTQQFTNRRLSLALAILLGVSRLGSLGNSIVTPRLVQSYGIVSATWMVVVVTMALAILSSIYLTPNLATRPDNTAKSSRSVSFRQFPSIYWQLLLICVLGYGGINTFTNSAQRFLAARYFSGDQSAAGAAMSITYVLSGVLVPPFGLILELSWFTIPQALFISNILMTFAHAAFFIRVTGFILPLSSLGVAYALYGTAFWAGLAQSILYAEDEEPLLHDESSALVSNADGDEGLSHEATNEDDIHHNPAIGTAEATSDLVAMGVGIATSLLNLSTAVVPMLLAVVETYAGYPGLEITFIALAGFGCLASFQLTRVRDFPSHKIDVG